jgi:hypothetical protein
MATVQHIKSRCIRFLLDVRSDGGIDRLPQHYVTRARPRQKNLPASPSLSQRPNTRAASPPFHFGCEIDAVRHLDKRLVRGEHSVVLAPVIQIVPESPNGQLDENTSEPISRGVGNLIFYPSKAGRARAVLLRQTTPQQRKNVLAT